MKTTTYIVLSFCLALSSCNTTPKPVVYGEDGCHFCKMTIVDKQHATQFITKKGRTYSFDAMECMLNHLKETDVQSVDKFLTNDYNEPGVFIDATQASYLISENIPSPMGEFLTAFKDGKATAKAQSENDGEVLTWKQLRERFK
ncbi:nitrous oxide reductase accessory protein NosL [Eudoraea chungangensis]|uniref:nitrous oxide reductase accessory protein NosL n=1 Tax=Eudoraea chungangensis TaxID=1481905 RepID=UPI0023ED4CAC|nr:nitrous oxide reductase accessory protein NosL [Eudoraea chungangensis]